LLALCPPLVEPLLIPRPPKLQNTDGDPLLFRRLRFAIASPQQAFEALQDLALMEDTASLLAGAELDAGGALIRVEIPWHKLGNEKHKEWTNTVLGRIVIDGPSLMVEVNSQRRAETIRARIEQHLGAGARYLNTEIESPQAMLARHDTDADAGEDTAQENELAALPEVRESLTQMLRAHYQRWIDEPIPLLGNRTPRANEQFHSDPAMP